jgi:hypothetical protein
MKTNEMTPAWVVENFLPYVDPVYDQWCRMQYGCAFSKPRTLYREFVELFFTDALAELLKAQREECAEAITYPIYSAGWIQTQGAVEYAPIPEPKNK